MTGVRPRQLYAWIRANHQNSSIALCCQVLGVRRERYYDWKRRPVHTDRDAETVSTLKQLRQQHPCYGKCYRRCKENHLLMRKKRPHSLTKADSRASQSDDLVQRDFTAPAPGMKYVSDMTEIKCADGKLYLAAILDCFDGTIVGYAMRTHMRASLCCDALRDAVSRFGYQAGLILHSDHGSQYTSREYRALLTRYGSIRQSMGRTHCCFDNARIESFFATLKKELIYRLHCASINRQQVRQMIFRWIETYYNRLRRNTANENNLPPLVKRRHWTEAQIPAA